MCVLVGHLSRRLDTTTARSHAQIGKRSPRPSRGIVTRMPHDDRARSRLRWGGRDRSLGRSTEGLGSIEHVLLLCLIAVVCFGVWRHFGDTIERKIAGAGAVMDGLPSSGEGNTGAASGGAPSDVTAPRSASIASSGSPSSRSSSLSEAGGSGVGGARRAAGGSREGWLGRGAGATRSGLIARGVVDGVADVVGGVVGGVLAIGGGVLAAATDPAAAGSAIASAVRNPGETAAAVAEGALGAASGIASAVARGYRDFVRGDAYDRARVLVGAGATFVPVGAAGNLLRGASAASHAGHAAGHFATASSSLASSATLRSARAARTKRRREEIDWNHTMAPGTDMSPGGVYMGKRSGIVGVGVNLTDDVLVVARSGVFTVAAHGAPGATTFARHRWYGGEIGPGDMADTMIMGGYRGGDVVLTSCGTACSRLPGELRRELDIRLEETVHGGRVGTIAAPSHSVYGDGTVLGDGHWRVFDADTAPLPAPPGPGRWAAPVVVAGATAGAAVVDPAPPPSTGALGERAEITRE
jgi:hypothetical protein